MEVIRRRALLAGAGIVAAGAMSLAVVTRWGKPGAPEIHGLVAPHPTPLQSIDRLVALDPPEAPAPATFTDEAGHEHRLADFAGRGLVVNLWATWCVPCVAEMPALAALAARLGEGALVLPLSSDHGGAAAVRAFYAAHGIATLPVWLDPGGLAARAWGARGIPTTLILDRAGRERGRLEGGADWGSDAALARLAPLMA